MGGDYAGLGIALIVAGVFLGTAAYALWVISKEDNKE